MGGIVECEAARGIYGDSPGIRGGVHDLSRVKLEGLKPMGAKPDLSTRSMHSCSKKIMIKGISRSVSP